jgi:serine/threonine protein kinase
MTETLAQGRYAVARRLATGGMGEVLLAEFGGDDAFSPGLLVVKRILAAAPGLPPNQEQVRMLLEEGRLALRLSHENLVDTFRLETDDASPLLVMELLSGRSMAQLLGQAKKRQEHVPIPIALAVLRGAARGLHFAHTLTGPDGRALGLVHRDVSPANIFVTFDGRVKVIDFGVAKSEDSELKTATGILKGKLGYMSPEQSLGEGKLTPQADIWSLGVFFWETLVTDRLFSSSNPTATLLQISQKEIPPPRSLRPDVPASVEGLTFQMLSRSLRDRFVTCSDIVRAIDGLSIRIASPAELGTFLAGRFPDEAAEGIQDVAKSSRRLRAAQPAEDQTGYDDDFVTTLVPSDGRQPSSASGRSSRSAGAATVLQRPAVTDDEEEAVTVRMTPEVVAQVRASQARARPPTVHDDDDDLATHRLDSGVTDLARASRAPTMKSAKPSALASATVPALRPEKLSAVVSSTVPAIAPPGRTPPSPKAAAAAPSPASLPSSLPSITLPSSPGPSATEAPTLQSSVSTPSASTLPTLPEPVRRPTTRSGLQTVPLTAATSAIPPSAPAPLPTSPPIQTLGPQVVPAAPQARPLSMVAIAVTTFGVLALLIGLAASLVRIEPEPMFFVFEDPGTLQSVVVGDPAHVPPGREYRVVDLTLARLHRPGDRDGIVAPRAELEARLKKSGVWARASLPMSSKNKLAAMLPLGVVALGLFALALALPAIVVQSARRSLVQMALVLVVAAGAAAGVRFGVLSWPGFAAFDAAPQLAWDE